MSAFTPLLKPTQRWVQQYSRRLHTLGFWSGVGLAAALSGLTIVLSRLAWVGPVVGPVLFTLMISAQGVWLCHCRGPAAGRWSGAVVLFSVQLILWFSPFLSLFIVGQVGVISLLRSFLFHRRWWALYQDLTLSLMALGVATYLLFQGASVVLSVWCYFLIQALAALISQRRSARRLMPSSSSARFDHNYSPPVVPQAQQFQQLQQRAASAWQRCQDNAFGVR